MQTTSFSIKTEDLAYWFFRLNGCLCLINFLVHHEHRGQEGTDVDVMAVRFPFRRELALSDYPMEDHSVFLSDGKIDLVIAEVKLSVCNLNGPWTRSERMNMQRVLYSIGAFREIQIDHVASSLYDKQYYEDDQYRFRLFALGRIPNPSLNPSVVQLTWDAILQFIFERFTSYERYKTQHHQWNFTGRFLYNTVIENRQNPDEFIKTVLDRLHA